MGGSSQVTGWNYRLAWHDGLCKGTIDAFLEFRGADKVAWKGRATESAALNISAPGLWGGDKDQGGVNGTLRLMFGTADQLPNAYLVSVFGPRIAAHRGMMTVAWEGGIWGANNPFAQKRSYRVERIKKGWDGDDCWYSSKAAVPLSGVAGDIIAGFQNTEWRYESLSGLGAISQAFTVSGDSGTVIRVTLTISGSVESRIYTTGTPISGAPHFIDGGTGGSTYTPVHNIYKLTVSAPAQTYFLNNGTGTSSERLTYVDAPLTIDVAGGATITLSADSVDSYQDGPAPQWLKADVSAVGGDSTRFAKNPAHMILEAHTQQHTGRQPRSTVHLPSLTAAADWFYARGFGLCTVRNPKEESPREFIRRIEKVSGCSFSQSLADGLWYLDIASGEYDLDALPVITDDDVLNFKETATVSDNVVNSVSVKYFDPERKESVITPPVRAMGLIAQFGEIHQTFEYPEIPVGRIAIEVATRELLARITPTRAFELDTRPTVYAMRRNQYVRLQLPRRGIADMVCLIGDIPSTGKLKSGAFQLTLAQDIYSLPSTVYTEVELGEDPSPPSAPAKITEQVAFEAPYIDVVAAMPASDFSALPKDAGYLVGAAVNPGRMRDFTMTVAPSGGAYAVADDGEFSPSCTATAAVEPGLHVGIGFSDGVQMAGVAVGDLALWDTELVRVDAIDLDAGTLDLGRGCADTLPHPHAADSRMFFYQHTAAHDTTQHIAGETVDVKLLTNSFSKQLSPADATAMHVTFNERIARPYPPADFKLNGVSVYSVGTPSTGGGGGSGGTGGGGGTGTPTTPPASTPDGAPASTTPGPSGGYPDNAPYPIPSPPVGGTDVMPDGDFTDPASIDGWMLRSNSQPLGPEWSIVGGRLQFQGAAAGYNSIAVCKLAKYSLGANPMPRYRVTVRAKLAGEPGVMLAVGVTGIGDYMSTPAEYITETVVEHVFEWRRQSTGVTGDGRLIYQDVMPVISIAGPIGSTVLATVDDVELTFDAISIPDTAEVPDHIDFDAGLTGWTNLPNVPGVTPALSVSAGTLTAETIGSGVFQYLVCDDPIALADVAGKYVRIDAECWCNDPTISQGVNVGGVRLGIMAKIDGEYTQYPITNGVWQRGDFTLRTAWVRVPTDATGALTWHVMVGTKASLGYKCKVRNISVHVTDSVVTD